MFAFKCRLREHVQDPDKLPILIFPEGTCINNTSVMQFKKGTFEVGGTIYPVAIKVSKWSVFRVLMINFFMKIPTYEIRKDKDLFRRSIWNLV